MAGEPVRRTYAALGRWIGYTHVKDSRPTGDGKFAYVLPGEGDVPLGEAVSLLREGGYDGYLTVEWEKQWHPELPEPEVALPAHATYLRRLLGG
jgi:sugar phosphate isomerase/epimerase